MAKRLLLIVALAATILACTPTTDDGSSPGTETLAPIESVAPSESMGTESASPAP